MESESRRVVLDPAAQEFVDAAAAAGSLHLLSPRDGRRIMDEMQDRPIDKPTIDNDWVEVPSPTTRPVRVRIVKPPKTTGQLPVVIFVHGGGWVLGDAYTHDRLMRDIAIGANVAVAFPDFDRSPEAVFPTAIEQVYATAQWITDEGGSKGLDSSRIAIAGDGAGANIAIATAMLAEQRGDMTFRKMILLYPITDAGCETDSYREFASGYHLTPEAMRWSWDQYTENPGERALPTASPLRASDELLSTLPETLIINAEADVLRDEGEAFASRLRLAGVAVANVRFGGTVHDFVMVNALHESQAAKHALMLINASLAAALDGVE